MTGPGLLFCFCVSVAAPPTRADDPWFGEDKFKHFVASFFATSVSASVARAAGLTPRGSAYVGAGFGAAAGVWKEIRDHARPDQTASVRDLVWDFGGVAAAAAVMDHVR